MDNKTRQLYDNLWEGDDTTRYTALVNILHLTEQPVDWAYEIWDDLIVKLTHKDNHYRARATQLLCNLAKSDPNQRIIKDLERIMAVTHDPKFVTARHTLQSVWRVGLAGAAPRNFVLTALAKRFENCRVENNGTLIRYDITVSLRKLYDETKDAAVKSTALALIETEHDMRYKKKYLTAWK